MEELLLSSLAQTDALAKLLIEKGLITQEEFMQKISEEQAKEAAESHATITVDFTYYFFEAYSPKILITSNCRVTRSCLAK